MTATRTPAINVKPAPRRLDVIQAELVAAKARMEFAYRSVENVQRDACMESGVCYHCKGLGYVPHHYHDGDSMHDECSRCNGDGGGNAAYYAIVGQFAMPAEHKADCDEYTRLETEYAISESFEHHCNFPQWKGYRVRVARGRKVKIGTEGVVFWVGSSQWGMRVGLRVDGVSDPVWVDAKNIDVVWAE